MSQTNTAIQQIDDLMKQKRWDEAQKLMEELFTSEGFNDQERGRAFVANTMLYLEALVAINQQYKTALEQANRLLKSVGRIQGEVDEDIDLTRLDAEIKNLKP